MNKNIIDYFYDISKIPRGSGNENGIAEYLENFAYERKYECYRDEYNNVLINKCGENVKVGFLLQAHTDMVCEKNKSTEHDFLNEGLKIYEKNGFLKAVGTTLGADDGIGVAALLEALENENINNIQCLFTSGEEVGLIGSNHFDYSKIHSEHMINIDGEKEGTAIVSSAGGVRTSLTLDYDTLPIENKTIKINVTGLAGGHSGADIHLGRANANLIIGRLLNKIYKFEPFNLVKLSGGILTNAIARESEAIISVLDSDLALNIIKEFENTVKSEIISDDNGFRILIGKAKGVESMLTFKDTHRVISLLTVAPAGVLSKCPNMPSLVESSSNLGVIQNNTNKLEFLFENRSSSETIMDYIIERFDSLAYMLDMSVVHSHRYPGWKYEQNTQIQCMYAEAYERLFGRKPEIKAIHAGLECGLFKKNIPNIDIISIAPNIYNPHTPDEKLDISSCYRLSELLVEIIQPA